MIGAKLIHDAPNASIHSVCEAAGAVDEINKQERSIAEEMVARSSRPQRCAGKNASAQIPQPGPQPRFCNPASVDLSSSGNIEFMASGAENTIFHGDHNSGVQIGRVTGDVHYHVQQLRQDDQQHQRHEETSEQKCHQLFRLTSTEDGEGYEWYKNRIEPRLENTCEWFLDHERYKSWKTRPSGPLLVSADPGCGKSVLAKYLVDHDLPGTVCYFFFKEQDQSTIKQALCALLHQLFTQKPALLRHAVLEYSRSGPRLIEITDSLWRILDLAVCDTVAGPVSFVLDALDECKEQDVRDMIRHIRLQFEGKWSIHSQVRFLITCRPYQDILSGFRELFEVFPEIYIPGEEHSDKISQEIDSVVSHRVSQLATRFSLSAYLKDHIERRLTQTPQRTYLWVYLVFEHLNQGFKKTQKGVEQIIEMLPQTVNEAYEAILRRTKDIHMTRKALEIVLGAAEPLALAEMNVALNIEPSSGVKSIGDLDMEEDDDFRTSLREYCGLFVSVYHGKVYLIHQTAREFLLAKTPSLQEDRPQSQHWRRAISAQQAHSTLAGICVTYINFQEFDLSTSYMSRLPGTSYPFFYYAARNWMSHFHRAGDELQSETIKLAVRACVPRQKQRNSSSRHRSYPAWFWEYQNSENTLYSLRRTQNPTVALIAAYVGLYQVIERLNLAELTYRDELGRSALFYAAAKGNNSVVRKVIERLGSVEFSERNSQTTPLILATSENKKDTVQLLLELGANPNWADEEGITALHIATEEGNLAMSQLLLKYGSNPNLPNDEGKTALHIALSEYDMAMIQMVLNHRGNPEALDDVAQLPLHETARSMESEKPQIKQNQDAQADAVKKQILAQPHESIDAKHNKMTQVLLERTENAYPSGEDNRTSLHYAISSGQNALIETLLAYDSEVNFQDSTGWTPLAFASSRGNLHAVKLLLDHHADVNAVMTKDRVPRTALIAAVIFRNVAIARLLLARGADARNWNGKTAISIAELNNDHDMAKVLQQYTKETS